MTHYPTNSTSSSSIKYTTLDQATHLGPITTTVPNQTTHYNPFNPPAYNPNYPNNYNNYNNNNNTYNYSKIMPQYEPNGAPAQGQGGNGLPSNALPNSAQYYPPNDPSQGQQQGMNMPPPQGQNMNNMNNMNPYGGMNQMGQQGMNQMGQMGGVGNNGQYDPNNLAGQQTINVQVSVPHSQQQPQNPMTYQPTMNNLNNNNKKKEELVDSCPCCKPCLNPCWIAYIIIYFATGIVFLIGFQFRLLYLVIPVYFVLLIMDGILVKLRDEHNVMCDCSSDPIEEGRVKLLLFMVISHLIFIICGSIFYASKEYIWGYVSIGIWVLSLLAGMYVASEPEDE